MEFSEQIKASVQEKFPAANPVFSEFRGDTILTINTRHLLPVCTFLKNDPETAFVLLEDMTVIDWATRTNRFCAVYHMFSVKHNFRLRVMAAIDDATQTIESVSGIWKTANWQEREAYDMYGITFGGHPDHRRMYMPEEFEYHPLRKEFPVLGIPGSIPLPKK